MKYNQLLFLEQSYKDSKENYQNILNGITEWPWDLVVITASNETQKCVYESQIKNRIETKTLPNIEIIVISDKDNKRIGSGGATLNVIKEIKKRYQTFDNKKILLINSGGDSKRVPQYSACGKLFSKVPRKLDNNSISTLFDEFMITTSLLAPRIKEGILICSGDVLLLFNPLQVDIDDSLVAAISIKSKIETGIHHGVFLSDEKGVLRSFLHKETKERLVSMGAVYQGDLIDIDTGCIYLSKEVVESLYNLVSDDNEEIKYINDTNRLNFYGDLLYPFASESTIKEYLTLPSEGTLDDNQIEIRKKIWENLSKYRMKVIKTYPSEFIHIGTTKEAKDLFVSASNTYNFLGWKSNIITNNDKENISSINSLIEDNAVIGTNILLEDSIVKNDSSIGDNSIVINVKEKCHIPSNTVVQILPIKIDNKTKYVGRTYHIDDNPKEKNSFFKKSYTEIFENLFDSNTPLWDLKLFPICDTTKEALDFCEIIYKIVDKKVTKNDYSKWLNSERLSLNESFNIADINFSIKENEKLKNHIITSIVIKNFLNGIDVKSILNNYQENIDLIINELELLPNKSYKEDALLAYLIKNYSNKKELATKYEDSCYQKINDLIEDANTCKYTGNYKITKDIVKVMSPARINLAGGWSDTPPYCLEHGGIVLNAAIKLNNDLPIKVTVESLKEQVIIFRNDDLKEEIKINDLKKIQSFDDLNNPYLLSQASLYILGIDNFDKLNHQGIKITTNVNLPKGSGLGTSSILSGIILSALAKYLGVSLDEDTLFTYVLYLEQLIKTGGGWQDQIGGLTNGIKLIETNKSTKQVFKLTFLEKNQTIEELDKRMVLIYTGQRRVAKNVLRKIMNKYIMNDEKTLYIIKYIQKIALLMKFELEKGTIEEFNKLLNKHSELIMELDDEVTNTCINHIIKECDDYVDATHMMGAGGGGFILAILKENMKSTDLENHLNNLFSDSGIKVYEADFYE